MEVGRDQVLQRIQYQLPVPKLCPHIWDDQSEAWAKSSDPGLASGLPSALLGLRDATTACTAPSTMMLPGPIPYGHPMALVPGSMALHTRRSSCLWSSEPRYWHNTLRANSPCSVCPSSLCLVTRPLPSSPRLTGWSLPLFRPSSATILAAGSREKEKKKTEKYPHPSSMARCWTESTPCGPPSLDRPAVYAAAGCSRHAPRAA